MISEGFEFNKTNFINEVPMHGNYLNCPAHAKDIDEFNKSDIQPLFKTMHDHTDCCVGKTIDFTYFMEDHGIIFIGFTDGTFMIRKETEMLSSCSSNGYTSQKTWMQYPILESCLCVYDGEKYGLPLSYAEEQEIPYGKHLVRITLIGKWIAEHTDIDVIGFYESVKEKRRKTEEYIKQQDEIRDRKHFEYLKEKYGWK